MAELFHAGDTVVRLQPAGVFQGGMEYKDTWYVYRENAFGPPTLVASSANPNGWFVVSDKDSLRVTISALWPWQVVTSYTCTAFTFKGNNILSNYGVYDFWEQDTSFNVEGTISVGDGGGGDNGGGGSGGTGTGGGTGGGTTLPPDTGTPPPVPGAPQGPGGCEGAQATIHWTGVASPALARYNVYQDTNPAPVYSGLSTFAVIKTVEVGVPTVFRVTSVDTYGNESDFSPPLLYTPCTGTSGSPTKGFPCDEEDEECCLKNLPSDFTCGDVPPQMPHTAADC